MIIFYKHIISYFSLIHCCKINESFIPVPIKIIKSIFIFFLSNIFNLLFLNQNYYIKKFNHFNEKYKLIHSENLDLKISTEERIRFALNNTFIYAIFTFILLIIVNFILQYFFFSIRNNIEEIKKNNISNNKDLLLKIKKKNKIFFTINILLMILFFLIITAFGGAYGGGFLDYFIPGIISLIFLKVL